MCGNMGVGNKLKAAELNAYLVANYKDSVLVAKTFQNLKMCRGLYTRVSPIPTRGGGGTLCPPRYTSSNISGTP